MAFVYILYSTILNKYYVGSTADSLDERLRKHNTNHKGFTGGIGDWKIVYKETYDTKAESLKREFVIKSWQSRRMIEKLIQG